MTRWIFRGILQSRAILTNNLIEQIEINATVLLVGLLCIVCVVGFLAIVKGYKLYLENLKYKTKEMNFSNKIEKKNRKIQDLNKLVWEQNQQLAQQTEENALHKGHQEQLVNRYIKAMQGAKIGIWEWEPIAGRLFLSDEAKELLGFEQTEQPILIGHFLSRILDLDRHSLMERYCQYLDKRIVHWEFQFRVEAKENRYLWMQLKGKATFDDKGHPAVIYGVISNISDEKLVEAKIHKLAYSDELTGIYNRAYFLKELESVLARRFDSVIGVYIIDVDNFKSINDALGHYCGDKVLQKIVQRLQRCLGSKDLLARFGGDEFIIYKKAKSRQHIEKLGLDIIDGFNEGFEIEGQSLTISVSVGIALIPADGDSVEDIVKCADIAMSQAKKNGKNCYAFHTSKMKNEVVRRSQIEKSLRYALINNEFKQIYQPIFNLRTNEITGFEALIRWRHPKIGDISPDEFIPIAEDIGFITEIGDWVTNKAIRQLKCWHEQGYDHLNISINLSARQFKDMKLGEKLHKAMLEEGIDPKFIDVEITETAALGDINYANKVLKEFRETGMHVSLDDFGTGYSSLNYLKHLPFTNLKIDKSFINDIMKEKKVEEIIRAIISLSHAYGMRVIAEGVETKEQLEFLKSENCDLVQGYYISKPLVASDVEILLKGTA